MSVNPGHSPTGVCWLFHSYKTIKFITLDSSQESGLALPGLRVK